MAKDEACYLPEWIFHHLYFGFDEIEVLLNRTEDASAEVLEAISKVHSNVRYSYVDWIDATPSAKFIQYISYAKAFHEAKISNNFSHIMFLDIDEFWLPRDLKTRPHDLLSSLNEASTLSFNWLNLLNEKEFASIGQQFHVQPAHTVKSIIRLDSSLKKIQLHLPELQNDASFNGHLLGDGSAFKSSPQERQRLNPSVNLLSFDIYIAHRKFRSELEYTAMLLRGRPSDAAPFKLNRPGYIKSDKNAFSFSLPKYEYQVYDQARKEFNNNLDVEKLLESSQSAVREKAQRCIDKLLSLSETDIKQYRKDIIRIFSGLNSSNVKIFREKLRLAQSEPSPAPSVVSRSKAYIRKLLKI